MSRNTGFRPLPRRRITWTRAKRIVRLGVKSLWLHRLRSLLTVLGIVFGVCSVIAMLAVGEGASFAAQEQIRQQGSNNIIVRSVKPPEDSTAARRDSRVIEYGITEKDLMRIRRTIPTVQVVVPGRIIRKKVWNVGHVVDCDVVATVSWYPEMRNHPVATGRFFTEEEMDQRAHVCVLSSAVVDDLFPIEAAIGKTVRVEYDFYRVVGILEPRAALVTNEGNAARDAKASENAVFIPITTGNTQFGEVLIKESAGSREAERVEFHEITIQVEDIAKVEDTAAIIKDLFERNHEKKDYEVIVPLELLRAAEETTRIFNIVLGAIAAISLVVGGIGIMNIMLASVTERTREIGIRRALGAKRRDIIVQFLVETVILSGAGGALGVALGFVIPKLITAFANMPTIVTFWSPMIAFAISGLIGIVFGLYPALRAANMDPVEALRHE